jgi:hypothetical protein
MTLIDRYLRAVRDHLPRAEGDDIINELSDSLHSRFEDEEASRGRPLSEDEEVSILRAFGHPMAVAARYRGDERSVTFGGRLIGPELFPIYMKVLAVNVAITVLIGIIALVAGATIWSGFAGILVPLAIQFAVVTAIFVAIDRRWIRDPDGWDPRTVNAMGPEVDVSTLDGIAVQLLGKEHARAVAVTTSILEIGLMAVLLTVVVQVGRIERIGFMEAGPGWRDIYVPSVAVLVFALLTPIVNLVRPHWTRFRVASHAAVDIAVIVIGAVSLGLGSWVLPASPATATTQELGVIDAINTFVRISIAATIVLTVLTAALEVRRLVRMGRQEASSAPGVSAGGRLG